MTFDDRSWWTGLVLISVLSDLWSNKEVDVCRRTRPSTVFRRQGSLPWTSQTSGSRGCQDFTSGSQTGRPSPVSTADPLNGRSRPPDPLREEVVSTLLRGVEEQDPVSVFVTPTTSCPSLQLWTQLAPPHPQWGMDHPGPLVVVEPRTQESSPPPDLLLPEVSVSRQTLHDVCHQEVLRHPSEPLWDGPEVPGSLTPPPPRPAGGELHRHLRVTAEDEERTQYVHVRRPLRVDHESVWVEKLPNETPVVGLQDTPSLSSHSRRRREGGGLWQDRECDRKY